MTGHFDSSLPARSRQAPAKRDTAEICRERAAADLLASVATMTAHQRQRMELSAATWTARAAMLQRVEDGTAARLLESGTTVGPPRL
jgi:hypothetical protein